MTESLKISWAKVHKMVREARGQSLAIYTLAEMLGVDKNSPELHHTITLLKRQGRVKTATGINEKGTVYVVAFIPKERKRARGA